MSMEKRILVVEDDEDVSAVYAECLADEGYRVRVAAGADDAIAAIGEFMPDLVLMDLGIEGEPALLARAARRAGAPVLLVSGSRDVERSAELLGADDWHGKPVPLTALLRSVATLVETRRDRFAMMG